MTRAGDGRGDVASATPNVRVSRMAVFYRRDVFPIVFARLWFHVFSSLLLPHAIFRSIAKSWTGSLAVLLKITYL